MSRQNISLVALTIGSIVFVLVMGGCLFFAESWEEKFRLWLAMVSIRLYVLTTAWVANLLGWNHKSSGSPFFYSLHNDLHHQQCQ